MNEPKHPALEAVQMLDNDGQAVATEGTPNPSQLRAMAHPDAAEGETLVKAHPALAAISAMPSLDLDDERPLGVCPRRDQGDSTCEACQ